MMKKFSIAIVFLLFVNVSTAQQTYKVLFLGNSYTATNNLPLMVHDIAKAMGDSLYYESNTPGGCTFSAHCVNTTSTSLIKAQAWDYVVLQEQSQLPSFSPAQVATDVFPYATRLDSLINANDSCTETVFFMTWGRKNGDQSNCALYPPVCTFEGMQARLRDSYLQMGIDNSATVAPVGIAWADMRLINPVFDLYIADESHPSAYGSYLTACVFYATLFHKSPQACSYTYGLDPADAAVLQQIATMTVFDSLYQWAGPGDKAYAGFTYSVNGLDVQFTDASLNATTYYWDFGDGQTSTLQHPLHTYGIIADYPIMKVASNLCTTDTIYDTVYLASVGTIPQQKGNTSVCVTPNPCHGHCEISGIPGVQGVQIILFDARGVELQKFTGDEVSGSGLEMGEYAPGVYFLRILGDGQSRTIRLIRQ